MRIYIKLTERTMVHVDEPNIVVLAETPFEEPTTYIIESYSLPDLGVRIELDAQEMNQLIAAVTS